MLVPGDLWPETAIEDSHTQMGQGCGVVEVHLIDSIRNEARIRRRIGSSEPERDGTVPLEIAQHPRVQTTGLACPFFAHQIRKFRSRARRHGYSFSRLPF